ncbi:hypothetical protein ABWE90_01330 [Pasteurella multocida]|uniref:hypothetical protein n=1 Tax=Pasteurella multocida TaxID=747 RepID=UPI000283917D|nr:hypothetical protein [Pasteurella multocida]ARA70965.1 hypothetical protein BTV67_10560 [Pasteurella multocida subsp. multocida]ARA88434.1 hypothetical protein BTV66_01855 [Pasteurella multocida subsp. septica]ARB76467.1 hypothetical protein A6J57_09620 [Pasteurella multocida]EJZ80302.1 hypothetical protein P1059_00740 [Pasteurella multocida subsp. gallicida P1059]MBE7395167.1 hypothetical protein [Pasteurella multocida]
MKKYLFHYYYQGIQWACDVYANSPEEAKEKVKAMSQAVYDGECKMEIYIPENPLSKIAKLIKSLLRKFS